MPDLVLMRLRRPQRYHTLRQLLGRRITKVQTAIGLGLTDHHVRRLAVPVRTEG